MISANMTIDVKEAEHVAMFSDTLPSDILPELEAPLASREAGQFAAQGFYFRHAIQTHDAAELSGGIFLERFRTWDSEKG
jgi:hypothetical protein